MNKESVVFESEDGSIEEIQCSKGEAFAHVKEVYAKNTKFSEESLALLEELHTIVDRLKEISGLLNEDHEVLKSSFFMEMIYGFNIEKKMEVINDFSAINKNSKKFALKSLLERTPLGNEIAEILKKLSAENRDLRVKLAVNETMDLFREKKKDN